MRESIARTLTGAGYVVLEGASHDEALSLYKTHSKEIDLLLVDAALPEKNGFEVARILCQIRPDLKVLFTSGDVGAQLCRYYGMSPTDVRFLKKPFLAIELVERVRCVLTPGYFSFKKASS